MKIIDRYLFSTFIWVFLFCTVFLYIMFVIGDIFGFLDEILQEHISVHSLLSFYFYMMPFVITQLAPISSLLASVFLLGNLNRHNEITALKASGVSLIKILQPVLTFAFIIGIFIFIINDRVVPNTMRIANKIRYEKLEIGKRGKSQSILMQNVALYGQGNTIIFAKKFYLKGNILEDLIIHAQENNLSEGVISKISAKKAIWTGFSWLGKEVVVYDIDNKGQFVGNPKIYEEKDIPLKETPLDFVNNQWQPQFMGYIQLRRYLKVFLAGSRLAYRRFSVDLQYKLAFPFCPIVMILIASPFTLVTSRGKALLGIAKGILIGLSYIPIVAIGLALGKGGILPSYLAAWSANILLGGLGLYLTLKN